MLHDPAFHAAIKNRLQTLHPTAERQWGLMRVDSQTDLEVDGYQRSVAERQNADAPAARGERFLRLRQ
jgi:hypothetical protein